MSMSLQALTPAGQQTGGLANGPTVVSPAFFLFHDLGEGQAMQGFRRGYNTCPDQAIGNITWDKWVRENYGLPLASEGFMGNML